MKRLWVQGICLTVMILLLPPLVNLAGGSAFAAPGSATGSVFSFRFDVLPVMTAEVYSIAYGSGAPIELKSSQNWLPANFSDIQEITLKKAVTVDSPDFFLNSLALKEVREVAIAFTLPNGKSTMLVLYKAFVKAYSVSVEGTPQETITFHFHRIVSK